MSKGLKRALISLVAIGTLISAIMMACGRPSDDPNATPDPNAIPDPNATPEPTPTPIACPTGYIPVPPLAPFTTEPFCVAKYEMKESVINPNALIPSIPVSQPSGKPWLLNRNEAINACENVGNGYSLITNNEWMTIARNIEQVAENWSDREVGVGELNRGHFDNKPWGTLEASPDDNEACYGTDNRCSASHWLPERRTHRLSNGEVIWDFAGNASEWLRETIHHPGADKTTLEFPELDPEGQARFGPTDPTWGSWKGVGVIYGAEFKGVRRGGVYNGGLHAGIYAIDFGFPSDKLSGFRCIYKPPK